MIKNSPCNVGLSILRHTYVWPILGGNWLRLMTINGDKWQINMIDDIIEVWWQMYWHTDTQMHGQTKFKQRVCLLSFRVLPVHFHYFSIILKAHFLIFSMLLWLSLVKLQCQTSNNDMTILILEFKNDNYVVKYSFSGFWKENNMKSPESLVIRTWNSFAEIIIEKIREIRKRSWEQNDRRS